MNKYWRTDFWYKTARIFAKYPIYHKFNYSAPKCKLRPPFIVLCNHTTDYDALLLAGTFRTPIHFVISDHVTSIPLVGKLINHFVGTVPITKSTTDAVTARKMIRIAQNGGALGIFPEGNKSFSGSMSYIKPSIAKLVKKLNIPVVIFNIEGGYFSSPRWTKIKRRGYTNGKIKYILMPEDIAKLTDDELYNKIVEGLTVDAYKVQSKRRVQFVGKDLARHVEQLLYMCPICGSLNTVYGEYNHVKCHNCDLLGEFDNYGYIIGTPFRRLDDWDNWQKSQLKNIKVSKDEPIFEDKNMLVKKATNNFNNKKLGRFDMSLFKDKLVLTPCEKNKGASKIELQLKGITGYALEGASGLQLWTIDNEVYRINGKAPINGLKYANEICVLTNQKMHF